MNILQYIISCNIDYVEYDQIDQEGTNAGTRVTNNTPEDEVRSLNEEIQTTSNRTPHTRLDKSNSTFTNDVGKDLKLSNHTLLNNIDNNGFENRGRRKSRAILEHLMTRSRFYKIIENNMNKQDMRS